MAGEGVPLSCVRHCDEQYNLYVRSANKTYQNRIWRVDSPLAGLLADEAPFKVFLEHGGECWFGGTGSTLQGGHFVSQLLS